MSGLQASRLAGFRDVLLCALFLVTPVTVVAQDVDHGGHAVHDRAINFQVLFDQLEWQFVHGEPGYRWDSRSWVGGDIHRLWVRTEGDAIDGVVDVAEAQLLYGRSIARWWDAVAGVRFDARPSPSHTWLAIGVQGKAPQFIDVQATIFVGSSAHVAARIEVEHDMHVTQRVVFQPLVELSLSGLDDADRGIGAGLTTAEVGFRFRYELKRELAPYVGMVWHQKLFGTGDFARARSSDPGGWHVVAGLRFWM
jgi:copper resistance protein B